MDLDEDLCLCFHVSQRKVINFVRVERPLRSSQISECGGAGTGCGWCRPFLQKIFDRYANSGASETTEEMPSATEYRRLRGDYIRSGKGTPPPGSEVDPAPPEG